MFIKKRSDVGVGVTGVWGGEFLNVHRKRLIKIFVNNASSS